MNKEHIDKIMKLFDEHHTYDVQDGQVYYIIREDIIPKLETALSGLELEETKQGSNKCYCKYFYLCKTGEKPNNIECCIDFTERLIKEGKFSENARYDLT